MDLPGSISRTGTKKDRISTTQVVQDALIRDLRARAKIDATLTQVDFVVFSGDTAFYGRPEEFAAARQNLFDPVLDVLGLLPERLFMVPGNHDLNRNTIYEMLPPGLQKPLDSDAAVQTWLTDAKKRDRCLSHSRRTGILSAAILGSLRRPTLRSVRGNAAANVWRYWT